MGVHKAGAQEEHALSGLTGRPQPLAEKLSRQPVTTYVWCGECSVTTRQLQLELRVSVRKKFRKAAAWGILSGLAFEMPEKDLYFSETPGLCLYAEFPTL